MNGSLLVFSPVASHPQDQGNRKRVHYICQALQAKGIFIDFLFYPFEWGGYYDEKSITVMQEQWDDFEYVSPSCFDNIKEQPEFYKIDDWWDEQITTAVKQKLEKRSYDAILCHYVFYSKILTYIPAGILKILDTHDKFSDR